MKATRPAAVSTLLRPLSSCANSLPVCSTFSSSITIPHPVQLRPRTALLRHNRPCQHQHQLQHQQRRLYSITTQSAGNPGKAAAPFSARTLASHNARIGKCLTFGLKTPAQHAEAAALCQILARDWRDLLAGGEGFLTDESRRGLWRHRVVWGDMDVMGHVNNVVYNKYAESARINWADNYAKLDPRHAEGWRALCSARSNGMILRSMRTDFKFPMVYPDRVTVLHKLASTPSPQADAFVLDVLILSEKQRRPAARAVEDIVLYDYQRGRKTSFEQLPFIMAAFQDTLALQEEMRARMAAKAADLEARICALETGSWDRAGAVEDLGSASRAP